MAGAWARCGRKRSGCTPPRIDSVYVLTMYLSRHKDYLYQKRLARELPLDSFRFDFR